MLKSDEEFRSVTKFFIGTPSRSLIFRGPWALEKNYGYFRAHVWYSLLNTGLFV